ncbi:MAG: 23S rRNA (pseudouridine(1915)-N(3))-methyltransferase RlmH [Pseudomonadales bacterium]
MRVLVIAVGTRMPAWVEAGVAEYTKRLGRELPLTFVEIPLAKRGKNAAIERLVEQEAKAILTACPAGARLIALDVKGKAVSTEKLATSINDWRMDGRDVALLVGGPDGLAAEVLSVAEESWSLSAMTLPHPLVRVILAEQIYRAWSINQGHPYHR